MRLIDERPTFCHPVKNFSEFSVHGEISKMKDRTVAVVGLGYVGLPIAVAFGKHRPTIGFDINKSKIEELRKGFDRTGEVSAADLKTSQVRYTSEPADLKSADFIIVAVPT